MKRLVGLLAVALVVASAATAARGDPREQFTPADQARAKAMLLRKTDIGPGFKASKPSDDDDDFYCKALDESDLVLAAEAESADFEREGDLSYMSVSSGAQIYKTTAQSAESWRRGTSAAGETCGRLAMQQAAKEAGAKLVSFRKLAFPRVAPQTIAYRTAISVAGVPMILDLVALRNGRAQSGLFFASAPTAYPRAEEVRLAKIVAARTAAAMRGD